VLSSISRAVTIIALCFSLGLHWLALQSVAWTTMLVANARHAPLSEAVAKTLDGEHPCSLCQAVNKGKNSEKRSDLRSATAKIDMICVARAIRVLPRFIHFQYATSNRSLVEFGHSPPTPPPRSELA